MKEVKITFWVIVLIFISVFIYQNQAFFFQMDHGFRFNLIFTEFKTPGISSALIFLCSFLAGFLISYAGSIPGRMKSGKRIKLLQSAYDSQLKEIASLNNKIDDLQDKASHAKPVSESMESSQSNYR